MGETPAVCVRIPTGGGKTFLAAHAVAKIGKTFCDTAAPVVLWLTPSDAIRSQTLSALTSPRNPCRATRQVNGLSMQPLDFVRVFRDFCG